MTTKTLQLPYLPKRVHRSEFKDILYEYVSYLFIKRYTKDSIRHYRTSLEHFFYWLKLEKISSTQVEPIIINRFINEHISICKCTRPAPKCLRDIHAALYLLLKMQKEFKNQDRPSELKSDLDKLIDEFNDYLLNVCGVVDSTRISNLKYVRIFFNKFFSNNSIKFSDLTPIKVREFLYNNFKYYKHNTFRTFIVFIRKFFIFLKLKGLGDPLLLQSLPKIVEWKITNLPNSLNKQEVNQILAACDRSSAIGKRDYAIIIFMLELGLRAIEVVNLTLDAINWRSQIVRISCHKRHKNYELPLTNLIIEVLIDYLKYGRPKTNSSNIFVYHVAHSTHSFHVNVGQGITVQTARQIVLRAIIRSGIKAKPMGSHLLRRTFATNLLKTGATIKEIADLLGHSSIDTTTAYTKVDFDNLVQVSLPWLKEIE